MQQPQQMQGGLGALNAPRQNYGFGSFVKKAIRGVKKIAKSPLGKAALIGGGAYLLGGSSMMGGKGMFNFGAGNAGRFGNIGRYIGGAGRNFMDGTAKTKMGGLSNLFRQSLKGEDGKYSTAGNPFSMGKLGLGALAAGSIALPFMGSKGDDIEEEVDVMDVAGTGNRARNFYSGLGNSGVGLDFMPQKKYVNQNFYAADGGRAGYAMGGNIDEDEEEFIRSNACLLYTSPSPRD